MLDRLRGSQETGVEGGRTLVLGHDLRAFLGNAHDRCTGLALGLLLDQRENLFEALNLTFGLAVVLLKGSLELLALSGLRHLWQGSQDLLLCEVDVLERVVEEVVEFFRFFGHACLQCSTRGAECVRHTAQGRTERPASSQDTCDPAMSVSCPTRELLFGSDAVRRPVCAASFQHRRKMSRRSRACSRACWSAAPRRSRTGNVEDGRQS